MAIIAALAALLGLCIFCDGYFLDDTTRLIFRPAQLLHYSRNKGHTRGPLQLRSAFKRQKTPQMNMTDDEEGEDRRVVSRDYGSQDRFTRSSQSSDANLDTKIPDFFSSYFIPGFVAVWAIGYGGLFLQQMSYRFTGDQDIDAFAAQGLGESGGLLGVAFTLLLFVALVGAVAYEVFRPEKEDLND